MNRFAAAALLALIVSTAVLADADPQPPLVALSTAPDLTGDWSGYWVSSKNGHRGPLRATFTRSGANCYHVRFRGRFAAIIPFRYATDMSVVGSGDGVALLSADKTLGPVLGSFRMSAVATATTFDADFNSKNDNGKFVLTRDCGR